jgi:hypothetical protein
MQTLVIIVAIIVRILSCDLAEIMNFSPLRISFHICNHVLVEKYAIVSECLTKSLSLLSDEICFLSFDILLIYYLSNVKVHEILKFEYFTATYSLAVKYIICKNHSHLLKKYMYRCSTFSFIH